MKTTNTTKKLNLMRRIGIGAALVAAGMGIGGCKDNSTSLEMQKLEEAETACRPAVFRYICAERSLGGGKDYIPFEYREMLVIDDDKDGTPDLIKEKGNPQIRWIREGYSVSEGYNIRNFKVVPGYTEIMPADIQELANKELKTDKELSDKTAYHLFSP